MSMFFYNLVRLLPGSGNTGESGDFLGRIISSEISQ